jgi:hypothetical protein
VVWFNDQEMIEIVSRTDSTVRIRFRKSGSLKLAAGFSTGCDFISDTLSISVIPPASLISLGKDTSVCMGNSITLSAGKQYVSYIWQDGSTDSTYQVSTPGVYFVQVTDSCGNLASDTIIVHLSIPPGLDAGPDRLKCDADTLHLSAGSGFTIHVDEY